MEKPRTRRDLQLIRRILRKLTVYGKYIDSTLTGPQVAALDVINKQGPIKVTHLAECLSLSLSAVTLLCDRLIQNDCVLRERDNEDRRVVLLELTEHGREVLASVLKSEQELIHHWLEGLSDDDVEQYNRIFQVIIDNARRNQLKHKSDEPGICEFSCDNRPNMN